MTAEYALLPRSDQAPLAGEPYHYWRTPDGDLVASFYRTPDGYLLRFPGRADFKIAPETHEIACTPVPGVTANILSALYYNQVLPLARSLDGALVLHASAVSARSGTIAFAGPSGRGKSTLAATFARAGHPFLSDDGVWLERSGENYLVSPHRPGLRLWPDSEIAVLDALDTLGDAGWAEKTYRTAGPDLPFEDRPQPLRAIYLLGERDCTQVIFERLSHAAALVQLVKAAFILEAEDRRSHQAHFERIAVLAETIPCFALDYPRRYEALPRVIGEILAHADTGVATS